MKTIKLPAKVSRTFHRAGLQVKKHSPEILIVAGVIGTVASAVMACRATLKVNEVTKESKENIERIHVATEKGVTDAGEEYTKEDGKKDLAIVYAQTGLKFVKLYGPSVALGAASIGCILTSHRIVRKRNIALAAAYTAVDSSFKEYRGRVVERFGKELDRELKYNIKTQEVEEKIVDEKGKEKIVKKTVQTIDPNDISDYDRFFDDGCKGWDKNPEYNLMFLKQTQNWANDVLRTRGHLFLNEVYDALGINRTEAGQIVGWIYDEENPNGDNYVDFGIYDLHDPAKRKFVNGDERVILLSFNVDGPIHNLIG